jgi:predicted ATPase
MTEAADKNNSAIAWDALPLYGVEVAVKKLQKAQLESRQSGQIVWVFGNRGCGKTSLVLKTLSGGYIAYGMLEKECYEPFPGLVEALTQLCERLEQSYANLEKLSEQLTHALRNDAAILASVVPSLTKIMQGLDQPHRLKVTCQPEWTWQRFTYSLQTFFRTICTNLKIPVVLFLDDLHHADPSTLKLIQTTFVDTNIPNLLFVGSYCKDYYLPQATVDMPAFVASIQKGRLIQVQNLSHDSVHEMLQHLLRHGLSVALADFVYERSAGNPKFVKLLLQRLVDGKNVHYHHATKQWQWDMERTKRECDYLKFTDVWKDRIEHALSDNARQVLTVCAFLGQRFRITHLDIVLHKVPQDEPLDMNAALNEAVQQKLLTKLGEDVCVFEHDEIVVQAQDLVRDPRERAALHYSIGRTLQTQLQKRLSAGLVLMIYHQYSMGRSVITEYEQRVEVCKLSLAAAKIGRRKAAFHFALECLTWGVSLLDDEQKWNKEYQLSLDCATVMVEIHFALRNYASSLVWIDEIKRHAKPSKDQREALLMEIKVFEKEGRLKDAIQNAVTSIESTVEIKLNDFSTKRELSSITNKLKSKSDGALREIPLLDASDKSATTIGIQMLWLLVRLCDQVGDKQSLLDSACVAQMKLALDKSHVSDLSFALYARVLGQYGYLNETCRFADLALKQLQEFPASSYCTPTLAMVTNYASHLQRPWIKCIDPLLEAYQVGVERGQLYYGTVAAVSSVQMSLFAGVPLKYVQNALNTIRKHVEEYGSKDTVDSYLILQQHVWNLRGESLAEAHLLVDQQEMQSKQDKPVGQLYFFCRLMQSVFMQNEDDMEYALQYVGIPKKGFHVTVVPQLFFVGLASQILSVRLKKGDYKQRAKKACKELEKLVKEQAGHLLQVLQAERQTSPAKILKAYEDAIRSIPRGAHHHAALAHELVATRHFLTTEAMQSHKDRADALYRAWGCQSKVSRPEPLATSTGFLGPPSQKISSRSSRSFGPAHSM